MLDSPGLVVPPRLGLVSFSIHRKLPSNELGRFLMSHFIFFVVVKREDYCYCDNVARKEIILGEK